MGGIWLCLKGSQAGLQEWVVPHSEAPEGDDQKSQQSHWGGFLELARPRSEYSTKDSLGASSWENIGIRHGQLAPDRCRESAGSAGVLSQVDLPPQDSRKGPGLRWVSPGFRGLPGVVVYVSVCPLSSLPSAQWKLLVCDPSPALWPHLRPQRLLFLILEAGIAEESGLF